MGKEESALETTKAGRWMAWCGEMAVRWKLHLVVPGVISGLTNTDVAAVVTYTQSGSEFGLSSVKFQVLMIPFMYCAQELGARLGTRSGRGLLSATRELGGPRHGWVANSVFGVLLFSCGSTLFCEVAGVAAAAELWDVPSWAAIAAFSAVLVWQLCAGSVVSEYLSIALASLLSFFVILAGMAIGDRKLPDHADALSVNVENSKYDLIVVSATVGSSLTPFLLFYQCGSAVLARASSADDLKALRINVLVGVALSVVCSIAVTVSSAYEFWDRPDTGPIKSIQDCGEAFSDALGQPGTAIFSLGLVGSAVTSSACTLSTISMAWNELKTSNLGDRNADRRLHHHRHESHHLQELENPRAGITGDATPLLATDPDQGGAGSADGAAAGSATKATQRGSGPRVLLPPTSLKPPPEDWEAIVQASGCSQLSAQAVVLGVGVLCIVNALVLVTTENQQVHLEVWAQDLDCLLIPAALALALFVARRLLDTDVYSPFEFKLHCIGAFLVSAVGLMPLVMAALIDMNIGIS